MAADWLTPAVVGLGSFISGIPQTDKDVVYSKNVYPGEAKCNLEQAHSIWHEVSANGLVEIIMMTDYVNGLMH
jgi:hypothetical protein